MLSSLFLQISVINSLKFLLPIWPMLAKEKSNVENSKIYKFKNGMSGEVSIIQFLYNFVFGIILNLEIEKLHYFSKKSDFSPISQN